MKPSLLFTILTLLAVGTLAAPVTRHSTKAPVARQRDIYSIVGLDRKRSVLPKLSPVGPWHIPLDTIGYSPELDSTTLRRRSDPKEAFQDLLNTDKAIDDLYNKLMATMSMRPESSPKWNNPQSQSQKKKRDFIEALLAHEGVSAFKDINKDINQERVYEMLMEELPEWMPQWINLQPQPQTQAQDKETTERSTTGEKLHEFVAAHPEYESLPEEEQNAKFMELKTLHPELNQLQSQSQKSKEYRECMEGLDSMLCVKKLEEGMLGVSSEW